MKKPKIGDYGIRFKPDAYISQEQFNKIYPQGIFGKVIDVQQKYNSNTGEKLPLKITIRTRHKDGRKYHTTFSINHYKPITIK